MLGDLSIRPRRLRKSEWIRNLVAEVSLSPANLVQPFFVKDFESGKEAISGFTNIYRWGRQDLLKEIERNLDCGVRQVLLFGETPIERKDRLGSYGFSSDSSLGKSIAAIKETFGSDIVVFADVCLCPSTSHGHCGILENGKVANDESVSLLCQTAVSLADHGADFIAPSDMMDGRVRAIRKNLDQQGFSEVGILSYTAKYASSYYGPFREALGSSPEGGSRASYQMDFRNRTDAVRELQLDITEGADLVMVKPALAYLDIIAKFRELSSVPVVAYSVSGEYEMVKRLATAGLCEEKQMVIENLIAIRRAGAHSIISYYTSEIVEKGWL